MKNKKKVANWIGAMLLILCSVVCQNYQDCKKCCGDPSVSNCSFGIITFHPSRGDLE